MPSIWASTFITLAVFIALAFVLVVCRWLQIVFAIAIAATTYAIYFFTPDTLDNIREILAIMLAWPVVVTGLYIVLQISPKESSAHKTLALIAVGFMPAGAIFGFPGFPGTSTLLAVWIPPMLFLPMVGIALWIVAVATWRYLPWPYRLRERHWRAVTVAGIAMLLALLGPVALWL